jgi:hypothetical protein
VKYLTTRCEPRPNRSFDTDAQVLQCASRSRLRVAGQLRRLERQERNGRTCGGHWLRPHRADLEPLSGLVEQFAGVEGATQHLAMAGGGRELTSCVQSSFTELPGCERAVP